MSPEEGSADGDHRSLRPNLPTLCTGMCSGGGWPQDGGRVPSQKTGAASTARSPGRRMWVGVLG